MSRGLDVVVDTREQLRRARIFDATQAAGMLVITLVFGGWALMTAPHAVSVAAALLLLIALASFVRPAFAIYVTILLSLIGDDVTVPWWPFTKSFSMRESLFFLSDSLPITPFEIVTGVALFGLLTRRLVDRNWRFRRGKLFKVVATFGAAVVFGALRGGTSGGAPEIMLLQIRPMVYFVLLYVLITAEFRSPAQYRVAFFMSILGIGIQSIFSVIYYLGLPEQDRVELDSLVDHPTALIMNVVFVTMVGLLCFEGTRWKKWLMLLVLPQVTFAYLLSQRRGAMVALVLGLIVLSVVLFFRSRKRFFRYVPAAVACCVVYVLATWHAEGAVGLPANAVKSVLFPDTLSNTDIQSNLYRVIENFNVWYSIRSNPLLGLGFGRPYLVVLPPPDISSAFHLWQYYPHNSLLWMWLNLGFGGFVVTLYMFGRAVQVGIRSSIRQRSGDDAAMAVAAVTFVMMFAVFAYVDITWSIRPMLMLALSIAICGDFEPDSSEASEPSPLAAAEPESVLTPAAA